MNKQEDLTSGKKQFIKFAIRDGAIFLRIFCAMIATLLLLSLLNWCGFERWAIQDILQLIEVIRWDHVIPLACVIAIVLFRGNLSSLIDRMKRAGFERGMPLFEFDPINSSAVARSNAASDGPLTVEDVVALLKDVPGMDLDKLKKEAKKAHAYFLRNGITTRERIRDLVAASAVIEALTLIYIRELKRPERTPLDPVAIATWGTSLFVFGVEEPVIQGIVQQIRGSEEYAEKHQ
jgi:hypothetical protein